MELSESLIISLSVSPSGLGFTSFNEQSDLSKCHAQHVFSQGRRMLAWLIMLAHVQGFAPAPACTLVWSVFCIKYSTLLGPLVWSF